MITTDRVKGGLMDDPGLAELEITLAQFCDEVLSDLTIPVAGGLERRIHWRYRGREFRATVRPLGEEERISLSQYAAWRAWGQRFEQLPSRPIFESRSDMSGWEVARTIGTWRWMLRTASRRRADDDNPSPGDLAGRPVRPRPGPPSLSASAAAIPPRGEIESRHYERRPLPHGAARGDRHGLPR